MNVSEMEKKRMWSENRKNDSTEVYAWIKA